MPPRSLGYRLNIASPAIYHPDLQDLARAAAEQGMISASDDPRQAVKDADVVVITDTSGLHGRHRS